MQWFGTGSMTVTWSGSRAITWFFKEQSLAKQYSIKIRCNHKMCSPLFSRIKRSLRICQTKFIKFFREFLWRMIPLTSIGSSWVSSAFPSALAELLANFLGSLDGFSWKFRSNSIFSYFISALNSERFMISFVEKKSN